MKQSVIFFLSILLCNTASAEWTLAARTEEVDFYIDSTTVVRKNHIAKIWSLRNLKQGIMFGNQLVLSTKDYEEFNCVDQSFRLTNSILHSEHMGNGKVVKIFEFNQSDEKSISISPGTAASVKFNLACRN